MKNIVLIFVVILFFDSNKILAQGPPISTDTPILLGLDGGGVRTYVKYSTYKNGRTLIQPIAIPYNLTTALQVGIVQPIILLKQFNGKTASGIGNLLIFTKLQVFQMNGKAKTFRGVLKFINSFKTGQKSVSPQFVESQIHFVTGYITTSYGIYASIGYSFISNDLSDNFLYDFSIGYPLLPQIYPPFQLNLFIELNGLHTFESKKNLLTVSPGIQLIVSSRLLFESNFQIPVINDSNNIEYASTLGIRYLFF